MLKLPGPHAGLKIGIFGGSFNPAHAGHFHVASTAMRTLNLDWVWWIVARGNPLKSDHGDFAARLLSSRRLTDHHPRMRATDIELKAGLTYSIDVIRLLNARAASAKFVWLMGSDSLSFFHKWKEWSELARAVPIAVVARPGSERTALNSTFATRYSKARIPMNEAADLPYRTGPNWAYLTAPLNHLSSTELRSK